MEIRIDSKSFHSIEVYKCNYQFTKNNSGPVICRDCKKGIAAGLGIHRQAYKRGGYLCFSCFANDVIILTTTCFGTDAGFFIDSLDRLRACTLSAPAIPTIEVLEAVYKAMLDASYTSIEIFLGTESASVFQMLDAAEAAVGTINL